MLRVIAAASAPSRDHPFCPGLQSCFSQNQFEAHTGPFRTAQEADEVGRRFAAGFLVARVA
jgi:hypothetical protein